MLQASPPELKSIIKRTPMRLIVAKTDSNRPWDAVKVCEMIGKIKGLDTDKVGYETTENLRRLIKP